MATTQPISDRRHPATVPGRLPFVSVVIVNYNGRRFLDDCLNSLAALDYPRDRWEVVLVDNGSTDDSIEHLRQHFSWVRLVATGKNLGFAGGNNEGFRHARGELVALLNNDTAVDPAWLSALVEAVGNSPDIGGATSKILFKDEPTRINSAGLDLCRDGAGRDRGFRQLDDGRYDEPAEVFAGCGASLLLRRALLDDVGGFDERFFMYYEDLDLAWRARLRGWRFVYTPRSLVYHVGSGTSGEWSPFFLRHIERNRVFASVKNAPVRMVLWVLLAFCARMTLKWLRVLTLRDRTTLGRRQALAYVPSALSLLGGLPGMIRQRFFIRTLRRRVADRSFAHLIAPRSRAA